MVELWRGSRGERNRPQQPTPEWLRRGGETCQTAVGTIKEPPFRIASTFPSFVWSPLIEPARLGIAMSRKAKTKAAAMNQAGSSRVVSVWEAVDGS